MVSPGNTAATVHLRLLYRLSYGEPLVAASGRIRTCGLSFNEVTLAFATDEFVCCFL
jgi:hypothetical protein